MISDFIKNQRTRIKRFLQRIFSTFYVFLQTQNRYLLFHKAVESGLLEVGRHTYGIPIIDIYPGSERKVIIGNFCTIARDVVLITGGIHPLNWVSTYLFRSRWDLDGAFTDGMPTSNGEILIGSDVWIGTEAAILSGIKIGHGAVIAARSVVAKDVPPYAIAAGAPARVIKYRFEQNVIDQLLELKWWEWDDEQILEAIPLLSSAKAVEFLVKYGKNPSD